MQHPHKIISKLQIVNKFKDLAADMPVAIECFATWCGPCRSQMPHLAQLTKQYPNIYLISVSNEDFGTIQKTVEQTSVMKWYNVAVDPQKVVQQLMQQYQVGGIPHIFIFDSEGQLGWHGHPADQECEVWLEMLNQ